MATPVTAERVTHHLRLLGEATERLLAAVDALDDAAVAEPSALPGWSRAHLLTHLARNADAMRALLLAARTGVTVAMYPSRALRDADIAAGATRPAELIRLDVRAAAERFAVDAEHLGAEAWAGEVDLGDRRLPAAGLPAHRLREVAAHHVDLAVGYGHDDVPAEVAALFLDAVPDRFAGTALEPSTLVATDHDRQWQVGSGDGPRISGPIGALLAWALGRSDGAGLSSDRGAVPASPGWG